MRGGGGGVEGWFWQQEVDGHGGPSCRDGGVVGVVLEGWGMDERVCIV